jgi:hypothetical protein
MEAMRHARELVRDVNFQISIWALVIKFPLSAIEVWRLKFRKKREGCNSEKEVYPDPYSHELFSLFWCVERLNFFARPLICALYNWCYMCQI